MVEFTINKKSSNKNNQAELKYNLINYNNNNQFLLLKKLIVCNGNIKKHMRPISNTNITKDRKRIFK